MAPTNSQAYKDLGKKDKWRSHPPFGFVFHKGKLIPHPVEIDAVKEIVALRKSGFDPREISNRLNALLIPTRSKKPWAHSVVANVLSRIEEKQYPYSEVTL